MKKIEAIIRRERYEEVRAALEVVGYPGMMVTEIQGHGTQMGVQIRQGKEYKVGLINKLKLEIVCADEAVSALVLTIAEAARTGNLGDGKIFVSPIEQAMRIRTGDMDELALEAVERIAVGV